MIRNVILTSLLAIFTSCIAMNKNQLDIKTRAIEKSIGYKVTIVGTFKMPKGMDGYVIKLGTGKYKLIARSNDGTKSYVDLDREQRLEKRPNTSQNKTSIDSERAQLLQDATKTSWFEQGNPKAKRLIYVIAEPNCSACHYFYESIKPYIASGQLKVRWIMVSFLKQSSFGKSAKIISSSNPAMAMEYNENQFNDVQESGGISQMTNIPSSIKQKIMENNMFMNTYGFNSTPVGLFKSYHNKIIVLKGALPINEISKLVGMIK